MKIDWVVNGIKGNRHAGYTSPIASHRYRAILPAQGLAEMGWEVELVQAENLSSADLTCNAVVISKIAPWEKKDNFRVLSDRVCAYAEAALTAGIPVIADFNDDHFSHPALGEHWRRVAALATHCVVGSNAMGESLGRHTKAPLSVIGDPLGSPAGEPRVFRGSSSFGRFWRKVLPGNPGSRLKFVWYGSPTNWSPVVHWLYALAPMANEQPFLIWVVTQPLTHIQHEIDLFNARHSPRAQAVLVPWDETTQWSVVHDADIVLIPADLGDSRKAVKTGNRLTDALHTGRFVIASHVPAYEAFEASVFLTDDPVSAVRDYLRDPDASLTMIDRGQAQARSMFELSTICAHWSRALHAALSGERSVITPKSRDSSDSAVRLNLGCGDKILPGYINVDVVPARAGHQPDVLCDLHNLTPFESDTADEVLAVHVVEHFWRWEVEDILREWLRVLKPGASMILECPNLKSACEEFLKNPVQRSSPGKDGQRTMWVFYGDPAWKDPYMIHRWGYTPESLTDLMNSVGLVNVRQEPAQFKLREPRDMRIVGKKPLI